MVNLYIHRVSYMYVVVKVMLRDHLIPTDNDI